MKLVVAGGLIGVILSARNGLVKDVAFMRNFIWVVWVNRASSWLRKDIKQASFSIEWHRLSHPSNFSNVVIAVFKCERVNKDREIPMILHMEGSSLRE